MQRVSPRKRVRKHSKGRAAIRLAERGPAQHQHKAPRSNAGAFFFYLAQQRSQSARIGPIALPHCWRLVGKVAGPFRSRNHKKSNMDKRSFLKLAAASTSTALFQGCAHQDVRKLLLEDNASPTNGARPFPMTQEDLNASREARAIINGPLFGGAGGSASGETVRASYEQWKETFSPFAGKRSIPLESATPLALATARLMRDLELGFRTNEQKKNGRSASPSKPHGARATVNGTVITVPPRSKAQFTQRGYCLDASLPAPGKGEKFILRPMNKLMPQELTPLYSGLNDLAKRDRRVQRSMQYLVWALREAGTRGKHATAISRNHLDMMAQAYPNGDQVFMQYHQQKLAENSNPLGDLVRNLVKVKVDGKTYNLGDLYRMAEANDPARTQELADRTMEDVLNQPIVGEIPADDSDFSMVAPGVAAHAVGRSQLTPTITLANATDQPFEFDTKNYFAETQRQAQRVGLGPPENVISDGWPEDRSHLNEMEQFSLDMQRQLRDLMLENVHRIVQHALLNPMNSRFVGTALNATPVIGNMLQLHNLVTGKDWMTGEPLGCVAQALAAVGTIPGAGVFMLAAGASRNAAIRALANSAVTQRVIGAAQRTALVRDLTYWLSNDTARRAYQYGLPPGELSNRITEVMTGGCQRSWS